MKCLNTRTTQYNKMPNYITNSNLRLPNQEVANKRQKVLIRMYLSFLKHSTNTSPHVWKERHINNNMKQNIKNKLTLPLSQIHLFIFFPTPFIFPQNCFSQNQFCMNCLFCLGGEYKNFLMYLTQRESQFIFVFLYSVSYYCLYVFLSTHAVMCFLSVSGKTGLF